MRGAGEAGPNLRGAGMQFGLLCVLCALFHPDIPTCCGQQGAGVPGAARVMSSWTTKVEDCAPSGAHSLCEGLGGLEGLALVEPSSG